MAFLNTFYLAGPGAPLGSDQANKLDAYILDNTKKALNERYGLEHQELDGGIKEGDDPLAEGRHIPGKVGCVYVGLESEIFDGVTLSGAGTGAIAYATDTNNFYWNNAGAWQILTLSSETIGVADTLRLLPGTSTEQIIEMNHEYQQWTDTYDLDSDSTITTDCNNSNSFEVTLEQNSVLSNPTNMQRGATYVWIIKQDSATVRTLSFGSLFLFPYGVSPTITPTLNATDVITSIYDGTNFLCSYMQDVR